MRVGTRSILFGVHQFAWHPLTVALAWHSLYKRWPKWHEWVAIACHDLGYWGKPDMDGPEGRTHPMFGAELAARIAYFIEDVGLAFCHPWRSLTDEAFGFERFLRATKRRGEVYKLCIGHSRFYAAEYKVPISALFRADKASLFHDPRWFYLLRAAMSGELEEYMRNSKLPADTTAEQWWQWYEMKVKSIL